MAETISVIVPVYNIAPYLSRCLDSILAQTYTNIEVIAVNDGSSDESADVLEVYAQKDSRIRVIHKENGGVTGARLRGIAEAIGDWIGFVDGDDEIDPDMYERLLKNAQEYHAEISHCGYRMISSNGENTYFYNSGKIEQQDALTAQKALLDGSYIEPGLCNKLFHKDVVASFLQKEIMPTNIRINEDLLMNYYLFKYADRLIYEDFCPYRYMKRDGSATMSKLNVHRVRDPITVKRRILEDSVGTALEQDAKTALLNTVINVYNSLIDCSDNAYNEDRKQLRTYIVQHISDARYLVKRRWLFAYLIAKVPGVYRMIYQLFG